MKNSRDKKKRQSETKTWNTQGENITVNSHVMYDISVLPLCTDTNLNMHTSEKHTSMNQQQINQSLAIDDYCLFSWPVVYQNHSIACFV